MIYTVIVKPQAKKDLEVLKKSEPRYYQKAERLIRELDEHPTTGTGHPKPLGGDRQGQWSRRISGKHRLVYEIHDTVVTVLVLSAYGHYNDK